MPGIQYRSIGDLINSTLDNLPAKYQETMRDVKYPCMRLFFSQYKKSIGGGTGHRMQLRLLDKTSHKQVLPYQATATKHEDLLTFQVTDWTFGENKIEFDERVIRMNENGARIIEFMKAQRSGAYANTINVKEDMLTGVPVNASDKLSYWGLPYWFRTLALNVTDNTGSFSGQTVYYQDASTATTRAGIDLALAANARGRNFAGTYSGYADEQFFDLLRRAMTRTDFGTMFELEGEKPAGSSPSDMYVLVSLDMHDQLAKRVNKGPDDQNGDVERFSDPTFRGVKFIPTPTLGNYAYNPVYGIKRSKVYGIVLGDEWMKETPALNSTQQLRVWVRGIHDTSNLTSDDCRSGGFVLHTVRTAA